MNDTGVFQSLPGATDPWKVEAVEMDTARETVTTGPGLKEGTVRGYPACWRRMHVHGRERRRRRHLDTRRSGTRIEAEVPTVRCDEHGAQQVRVPWAEPRARFTMLFEDVAIALLQGMTTAAVARRLGISWDEADGIKQRAVRRGWRRRTARVMKHPRVDGKHAGHGLWLTIVSCVDDGKARVVHVAQGKDQAALDAFRRGLTDERPGAAARSRRPAEAGPRPLSRGATDEQGGRRGPPLRTGRHGRGGGEGHEGRPLPVARPPGPSATEGEKPFPSSSGHRPQDRQGPGIQGIAVAARMPRPRRSTAASSR